MNENSAEIDELATSTIESVAYPAGFAAGLTPIQLSFVGALNGVPAPDPAGEFDYCELGCGSGRTTLILGAANPRGRFVGIDLASGPIEAGRRLAKAGELENVTLLAEDVAEVDLDSLPDFDFITMHGLYAWVPAPVRDAILRFIDAKLKPGGFANLSYNAMPGWGAVAPIRQYFLDRAPHLDGEPTERAKIILDELETLRKAEASFFTANESAGVVLTAIRRQDLRYVVHEFFSPSWQPFRFKEVAERFAQIGLRYVGDSRTVENILEHSVPPKFLETLETIDDRIERETLKDFITNRFFRGDTYWRPAPGQSDGLSAAESIERVRIGMERTPAETDRDAQVSGAGLRVEGEAVDVLEQLLVHENHPLGDVLDHPAFAELDRDDLIRAILALTIERRLVPCARPSIEFDVVESALRPAPLLNRVLLGESTASWVVLACPVTGGGLIFHSVEACLLVGLCSPDPIRVALAEIDRRGIVLAEGENPVEESRRESVVRGMLEQFAANKLPLLYSLGVVEQV